MLASLLTAMGFSACSNEQPDLYGPIPLLYGPPPVDSTSVQHDTRSAADDEIEMPNLESEDNDEQTTNEPA